MNELEIQRRNQAIRYFNNDELKGRLANLFANDAKKQEVFKSSVLKIISNGNLATASVESIFLSAINLAEIDLDINPIRGLAYVVKYKQDAQAVIGYKGYLALAERAGKLIKADSIFKCDNFAMRANGFDDEVVFEPNFCERNSDDATWYEQNFVGVLVRIRDTASKQDYAQFVSKDKILKIAGVSPSRGSNYSPYKMWWQEMHLAKAIKYVLSKIPTSNEISRAIELDNIIDKQEVEAMVAANGAAARAQGNPNDLAQKILQGNRGTSSSQESIDYDATTGEVLDCEITETELS